MKTKEINEYNNDYMLNYLKTLVPEIQELMQIRYKLLRTIMLCQPIGRRAITNRLDYTERIVRKEASILKVQGLIDFSVDGMRITEKGKEVLENLNIFSKKINGFDSLGEKVSKKLNIKKVILATDGINDERTSLKEIGKVGASILIELINDGNIIGITGGMTVHNVVEEFPDGICDYRNSYVIPARGGLGKKTEYQANTLAEKLAEKINSHYRILYTPDFLSEQTIESLKMEPEIKEIVELMDSIDVLVFGVGEAINMAKRRNLSNEKILNLEKKCAVSEGFGYYFNKDGEIVDEISTIGIKLNKYKELKNVIAIARGAEKAEAIISISKLNPNLVLISDEETINKINELI